MNGPSAAVFIHPNPDNIAGQEKCLLRYVRGVNGSLQTLVVLPGEGRFSDLVRSRGVRVEIVERPANLTDVVGGLGYALRLWRLLRREKAAFVFCNGLYSSLHGSVAARLAGVPAITYVATTAYSPWDISRGTLVRPELFLCVSHCVQDLLVAQGIAPEACRVVYPDVVEPTLGQSVPSPAAARAVFGIAPDALVVGFVGQIIPRKNVEAVVRSASQVLAQIPNAVFLVAGDDLDGQGRHLQEMKGLAETLGVASRFVFPGFVLDPGAVYRASDLMVSPSLAEGLSRTMVEAFLFEVPGIYSDIPPHREVVKDEVNGLILRDTSVGELARQVVRLGGSAPLRAALGRAGRETFERDFSPDSFERKWREIWQSLLPRSLPN